MKHRIRVHLWYICAYLRAPPSRTSSLHILRNTSPATRTLDVPLSIGSVGTLLTIFVIEEKDHLLLKKSRVKAPTARPPLITTPAYNKNPAATSASQPTSPTSSFSTPSTVFPAISRSIVTMAAATSFWDFTTKDKKGADKPLSEYKGKVVLVVNTASKCGFTPQFAGLEKLYKDITAAHPDDFVILGFPTSQFASQEGSDDDIQEFCQVNYGVTFPILAKTEVNGDKPEKVWEWMKNEQPGVLGIKRVKWNFEKFLIGRDGKVKGRWASTTKPEALEKHIKEQLAVPKKE
ncbi:hypothetical protein RRF57_006920 [Xylaria bambusicola]|uniref:Glutathione peroxidase n=1 Tax=Xylaria bambusicola TaxID=326684 RepID=A0AAN7ZA37_9PEZI